MNFDIIRGADRKMYAGQIIEYKVSPLFGVKLNWVSEITQVRNKKFFVDEQRFGPYKFWHHKHFFTQTDEGVEIEDEIQYALRFDLFGLINQLIVQKQLIRIFNFRKQKLLELFPRN